MSQLDSPFDSKHETTSPTNSDFYHDPYSKPEVRNLLLKQDANQDLQNRGLLPEMPSYTSAPSTMDDHGHARSGKWDHHGSRGHARHHQPDATSNSDELIGQLATGNDSDQAMATGLLDARKANMSVNGYERLENKIADRDDTQTPTDYGTLMKSALNDNSISSADKNIIQNTILHDLQPTTSSHDGSTTPGDPPPVTGVPNIGTTQYPAIDALIAHVDQFDATLGNILSTLEHSLSAADLLAINQSLASAAGAATDPTNLPATGAGGDAAIGTAKVSTSGVNGSEAEAIPSAGIGQSAAAPIANAPDTPTDNAKIPANPSTQTNDASQSSPYTPAAPTPPATAQPTLYNPPPDSSSDPISQQSQSNSNDYPAIDSLINQISNVDGDQALGAVLSTLENDLQQQPGVLTDINQILTPLITDASGTANVSVDPTQQTAEQSNTFLDSLQSSDPALVQALKNINLSSSAWASLEKAYSANLSSPGSVTDAALLLRLDPAGLTSADKTTLEMVAASLFTTYDAQSESAPSGTTTGAKIAAPSTVHSA